MAHGGHLEEQRLSVITTSNNNYINNNNGSQQWNTNDFLYVKFNIC